MKMNWGIWIGLIGGTIGFLAGVVVVIANGGTSGIYVAVGMCVIFILIAYFIYKLIFKPIFLNTRLQKTGIPARARILEVRDTGVTINNNPQIKLLLEIKNNLGKVYTSSLRTLISRLQPGLFQAGMEVPVKIDPNDEQKMIIDYNSGFEQTANAIAGINPESMKTELEQLQQFNDAIKLSGRPARAIIKKYTWLGLYVNGNNPYVELELEVMPENSAAFSGKAKGVISELSVQKFQPGHEIFVKYDLYDNSHVTIDHS